MVGDEIVEFAFPSAVRGFHVYRGVWAPRLGQQLSADRERGNEEDRFTVAVDTRPRLTMTGSEVRIMEGRSREREGSEQRGRSAEAWRRGAQRLEGWSRERRLRRLGGRRELRGAEGLEIRQWRCSGQHLHCPISASAVC